MTRRAHISLRAICGSALVACTTLAACAMTTESDLDADPVSAPKSARFTVVEVLPYDDELVNIFLEGRGFLRKEHMDAFSECAAAGYAQSQGLGFARHLRTNLSNEGGIWRADAVYTISPALPVGQHVIDAETMVESCADRRIPTV